MHSRKKIFVIAGEASGDQLGSLILSNIKNSNNVELYGVGGKKLLKLGLTPIFNMDRISLMGLIEIIPRIPELLFLINLTIRKIMEINPDLIITIDAPGFNFRVLKKIKKLNLRFKNIHVVAPTVWAWKANRAKKISDYINCLFVLFPFEKKYFTPHGIKTYFIGHPLIEVIKNNKSIKKNNKKKYISIFPGSRRNEIINHLKLILLALTNFKSDYEYVVVAIDNHSLLIKRIIEKYRSNVMIKMISSSKKEEVFKNSFAAIAVSGTITLELALYKVPFFTVYKLNSFSYFFLKKLVYAKYITLINIIFDKPIVPELIQSAFTKDNIVKYLDGTLMNKKKYSEQIKEFKKLEIVLKNNRNSPSCIASNLIKKSLNTK